MKKLTFVFLLTGMCSFNNVFSQEETFDLSKIEKIEFSEKQKLMEIVRPLFPFLNKEFTVEEYGDVLHFIDIDNDSDFDLIYDGWSGNEPMTVRIFFNIKGKFVLEVEQYIYLKDIQFSENKLSKIHIYDPGCCAALDGHDYYYSFNMKKDFLEYWFTEHIEYHNDIEKPKEYFKEPIKFKVLKPTYYLRITPAIDSTSYFYPDDHQGNLYFSYETGDTGTAIAESIDKTGRVWWLVIMDCKKERNKKTNVVEEFPPKYKGWMSSRFLEKID